MKLRTPRTEIPPSTWGKDMLKLMHPMMFAPILMLVVIGTFLAEEVHYDKLLLTLVGIFFAVLSAYHLDEYFEKVTAPSVPKLHNKLICVMSFYVGLTIGLYFITRNSLLWIPTLIAMGGIVLYNLDIKPFSGRIYYGLVWGGTPIFGSYMLQTGELPNLTVIIFTIFGMLISIKLFWNWSLRTCGRYSLCPKNCRVVTFPIPPGYVADEKNRYCHSPNTMRCLDRLEVPKEINSTVKILQKLDSLILFALMIGVVVI